MAGTTPRARRLALPLIHTALPALICAAVLAAGCDPLGDKGGAVLLDSQTDSLAESGYPDPRAISTAEMELSPLIDPTGCAADSEQRELRSPNTSTDTASLRLESSEAEMAWAIYGAGGLDGGARPEFLELCFSARDGVIWLGFADFSRGIWEWQELPDYDNVKLAIDPDLGLATGEGLFFSLAVYGGDSAVFNGGEVTITVEPEPEPQVDRPEINGPYISLGYWDQQRVSETFAELSAAGVNFVIDYALTMPDDDYWEPAFAHYCDSAEQNGVGIGFWLQSALLEMTPLDSGEHLDAAVAMVAQLKEYDGISAWYVHDEVLPWIAGDGGTTRYSISLIQMQELYAMIHAEDPSRPQLSVWHTLPDFELFNLIYTEEYTPYGRPDWMYDEAAYEQALADMLQTTCDWVMIDMYPVGAPWLDGSVPAELPVIALTARAESLKAATQPLVFVWQAFSWAQYDPLGCDGAPFPTRDELDRMLCGAHAFGADYAIAYSWFDLADDLPGRDIPGRDVALENMLDVLEYLNAEGWPEVELAMGSAPPIYPVTLPKPPPPE